MTARTLLLIAAVLLEGANAPGRSEETPAATKADGQPKVAEYQAAVKSINAEVENSIAIFRDAVKSGPEEDGWRADVKEAASQWLKNDPRITLPVPPPSMNPVARQVAMGVVLRRMSESMNPSKLPWPASELAGWLINRIAALERQRREALADYAEELASFAEDAWLKAEKPGDLRSVMAAFTALDALAPRYIEQTNVADFMRMPGRRPLPRGPNGEAAGRDDPRRVDAFYAALLTAGDDPLILPDPKTDVEGFTRARVVWSLLLERNVPFQTRPRVAARIKELDGQYAALRASALARLNALILENAPPAVFEPALNSFNAFLDQFDPRPWGFPPPGPMPMPMMPMTVRDSEGRTFVTWSTRGLIHDYHDLLGARQGSMMPGLPWRVQEQQLRQRLASISTAGVHRAYREWLDFRRAEVNGAALGELDSLWEDLRARMVYLPREVKISIEKRRASTRAEAIVAASAPAPEPRAAGRETQAVAKLIAALEALAARAPIEGAASEPHGAVFQEYVKSLPGMWRMVGRQDPEEGQAAQSDGENAAPLAWRMLAEQADCLPLFALREKAVRSVLAQLPSRQGGDMEEAVPVGRVLEAVLEKCVLDGDWKSFHRVLRLDSAANLLAGDERLLWKQIGEAFEQASGEAKSSPQTARARYASILQWSDDTAITALAIRRLQALSVKDTRP